MLGLKDLQQSRKLIYQGGVALICLVNKKLGDYFEKSRIIPSSDNTSSILSGPNFNHSRTIDFEHPQLSYGNSRPHFANAYFNSVFCHRVVRTNSERKLRYSPHNDRSFFAGPRRYDIKRLYNLKDAKYFEMLYNSKAHL